MVGTRMKKAQNTVPGFNLRNMDTSVRQQDDFYHYANGGWLRKSKIPDKESRWGSFTMLRYDTEKNLKKIVLSLLKNKNPKNGSPERLVGDFYRSGVNMVMRNKLGHAPLDNLCKKIREISNTKELLVAIAYLHRIGVGVPWGLHVDQDYKNSSRYVLFLYQNGFCLPDRDYYLKDAPEFRRVRKAYADHILRISGLLGYTAQESLRRARIVMRIETLFAEVSMDKVDVRDAEKTYHKKSIAELKRLAPQVAWPLFFAEAGTPSVSHIIVMQPKFLKAATRMLAALPLEDWRVYLEWRVVNDASGLLSDAFVKASFIFSQAITGSKKLKPLWRRVLGSVNGAIEEPLGKIYVERYFEEKKKNKMDELVSDLFAVYEERIKNLDWMSSPTRRKAVDKLRMMRRKIGCQRKWKSYKGLAVKPDDYFGNVVRASLFEHRSEMKKLSRKSIDRNEWFMSPQTVNAYYHPTMNDIVFPAAILQPPFFNFSADDAINYGGIGAVIGHEMTHGFDDQGAKFDGHGNMKTWWSPNDKKKFERKGKILVKQYNEFKVVDGVAVNGKLTLGENIADLGGLVIGFEAYQKHLEKMGRKNLAGFTPEQRFFLGFAQAERELNRPEYIKTRTLSDPHSPPEFRINGPLAHFEPFYEAFGVKKGDKLYREPKERVHIW